MSQDSRRGNLPPLHKLLMQYKGKVEKADVDRFDRNPSMVCVTDLHPESTHNAAVLFEVLKSMWDSKQSYEFDSKGEAENYEVMRAEGKTWPRQTKRFRDEEIALQGGALAAEALLSVQNRLKVIGAMIAGAMSAYLKTQIFDGRDEDGNNLEALGFFTTMTKKQSAEDYYRFHIDLPRDAVPKVALPYMASRDFITLTMVYYLLDGEGDLAAMNYEGQGSTLYNMEPYMKAGPDTQVAYCPLRNGSISILDSSRYHAVGPNYYVQRGAVVYKCVLYRPGATERSTPRDVWWNHVKGALQQLSALPSFSKLEVSEPKIMPLGEALKRQESPPEPQ